MHIAFKTRQLRDLCENHQRLVAKWGAESSVLVRSRLAELRVCQSFSELEDLQLYEIQFGGEGTTAILVHGKLKIEVMFNQKSIPKLQDDKVDKSGVTRLLICALEMSDA